MDILTDFQKIIISKIGMSDLSKTFFLTGGTALSVFYLHHRYSDDLDFFTEIDRQVSIVPPIISSLAKDIKADIKFTRTFNTFLECFISRANETIVFHFSQDSPYRLFPVKKNMDFNINIDNEIDMACNKLSALFERSESKDFVDIYFINKEIMKIEDVITNARQKHVGIDDYWLAQAFFRVKEIEKLPRMIKSVTIVELQEFFLYYAKKLMENV